MVVDGCSFRVAPSAPRFREWIRGRILTDELSRFPIEYRRFFFVIGVD